MATEKKVVLRVGPPAKVRLPPLPEAVVIDDPAPLQKAKTGGRPKTETKTARRGHTRVTSTGKTVYVAPHQTTVERAQEEPKKGRRRATPEAEAAAAQAMAEEAAAEPRRKRSIRLKADVLTMWRWATEKAYPGTSAAQQVSYAIREGMQNGLDAIRRGPQRRGGGKFSATLDMRTAEGATMTIDDNGEGMSADVLEGPFLTIMETGKEGDATQTGGFGIGRAVLLGVGKNWSVHTRDMYMEKAHLNQPDREDFDYIQARDGTRIIVQGGKLATFADKRECRAGTLPNGVHVPLPTGYWEQRGQGDPLLTTVLTDLDEGVTSTFRYLPPQALAAARSLTSDVETSKEVPLPTEAGQWGSEIGGVRLDYTVKGKPGDLTDEVVITRKGRMNMAGVMPQFDEQVDEWTRMQVRFLSEEDLRKQFPEWAVQRMVTAPARAAVRLGGVLMYLDEMRSDSKKRGLFVVDITTTARPNTPGQDYPFDAGRSAFQGKVRSAFYAFQQQFAVDPVSVTAKPQTWQWQTFDPDNEIPGGVATEEPEWKKLAQEKARQQIGRTFGEGGGGGGVTVLEGGGGAGLRHEQLPPEVLDAFQRLAAGLAGQVVVNSPEGAPAVHLSGEVPPELAGAYVRAVVARREENPDKLIPGLFAAIKDAAGMAPPTPEAQSKKDRYSVGSRENIDPNKRIDPDMGQLNLWEQALWFAQLPGMVGVPYSELVELAAMSQYESYAPEDIVSGINRDAEDICYYEPSGNMIPRRPLAECFAIATAAVNKRRGSPEERQEQLANIGLWLRDSINGNFRMRIHSEIADPIRFVDHARLALAWDTIVRTVAEAGGVRGVNSTGFVCQNPQDRAFEGLDRGGDCVPIQAGWRQEHIVSINPFAVEETTSARAAFELWRVACHELAHAAGNPGHNTSHEQEMERLQATSADLLDHFKKVVGSLAAQKEVLGGKSEETAPAKAMRAMASRLEGVGLAEGPEAALSLGRVPERVVSGILHGKEGVNDRYGRPVLSHEVVTHLYRAWHAAGRPVMNDWNERAEDMMSRMSTATPRSRTLRDQSLSEYSDFKYKYGWSYLDANGKEQATNGGGSYLYGLFVAMDKAEQLSRHGGRTGEEYRRNVRRFTRQRGKTSKPISAMNE